MIPEKVNRTGVKRAARGSGKATLFQVVSTAIGCLCFVFAFNYCHGDTQLLIISAGSLLMGGSK